MKPQDVKNWLIVGGLLAGGYLLLSGYQEVKEKGVGGVAADATAGAIKGAGSVANGVFTGLVKGIGSLFGISETADTRCDSLSMNCTPGGALDWVKREIGIGNPNPYEDRRANGTGSLR